MQIILTLFCVEMAEEEVALLLGFLKTKLVVVHTIEVVANGFLKKCWKICEDEKSCYKIERSF